MRVTGTLQIQFFYQMHPDLFNLIEFIQIQL